MAVPNFLTYLANLRPKLALARGIATVRVFILADGRGGLQSQCSSLNISQDTGQNYAEQGTRGWNGRENQPHDESGHPSLAIANALGRLLLLEIRDGYLLARYGCRRAFFYLRVLASLANLQMLLARRRRMANSTRARPVLRRVGSARPAVSFFLAAGEEICCIAEAWSTS